MGITGSASSATNFIPSFWETNVIRFDKSLPRSTFSGSLVQTVRGFSTDLESEYDNIYISELPSNADTNDVIRGSYLARFQVNATPKEKMLAGVALT